MGIAMPGVLFQYLAEDHKRLDSLLRKAAEKPGMIDMESYAEFRKGLLRHIALEEKFVLQLYMRRGTDMRRSLDGFGLATVHLSPFWCLRRIHPSFLRSAQFSSIIMHWKNRRAAYTSFLNNSPGRTLKVC
jgi:hypothetical protein